MTRRKKLILRFSLLVVGGVGLVVLANVWKSSLTVDRITVSGNRVVDTNEILQLAQVTKGVRLEDVDVREVRNNVAGHYFLKEVVVERDLPATIKITVIERTPLAMITGEEILYVDEEGMVLPHSISEEVFDLPLVTGLGAASLEAGMLIERDDFREALEILVAAKAINRELYHRVSEVRLRDGGDLLLYAAEGGIPIIFGRGNVVRKLVQLEVFWNEVVVRQGSGRLQQIDLRFEDQIVVRWKESTTKTLERL
ncbi:MAG: FtsQ-type POTRA domain-containing protein [Bacteroidota bacterium]